MSDDSLIDELIASDPEMLESFVEGSIECLRDAESDLRHLRDHLPGTDQERVESAFRSVHSLKGNAAFVGLNSVADLAQCMEDLLGHMRKDTIAADNDHLVLLLDGVNLLDVMLGDPKGASKIHTEPLMETLWERLPQTDDEQ